ncbi:MAG: hypothetical protein LLG00_14870 [Planctomycetaceae bacterium]|nr:hypothetical protein [Planctomycetaceae bacterium]
MSTDYEAATGRELAAQPSAAVGFMTQPRQAGTSPAMLAEQQRAKSEIEAALTIANHMPRDEKRAMDSILISCQRRGLAAKSQYEYSRGGTAISGASIVLMEAIAQRWGNIDFGFRELSRYPARGNQPGESVVEAYAWDLESNTRRKVVFTVEHAMKSGNRIKVLTDPRDVYEYIANQAQRRVRTCLENIIPRDIVEAACEECDKTLKASIADVAKATADMLRAFEPLGVTKEMVEGRIQRRVDAITPAQIISLRKIYVSMRDGMSEVADWFKATAGEANEEKAPTAAEKAKAFMRSKSPAAKDAPAGEGSNLAAGAATAKPADAGQSAAPPTREREPGDDDTAAASYADQVQTWLTDLESVDGVKALKDALKAIPAAWPDEAKQKVAAAINAKVAKIHNSRGGRSNPPAGDHLFETQESATEAGF